MRWFKKILSKTDGRISAPERIAMVFDWGFTELYQDVRPVDFLGFEDTKKYQARLAEAREATSRNDAVICGKGSIDGVKVLAAVFNFKFMGGSMGSVVGEKITRLLIRGIEEKIPVIVFCASGGARLQEGIVSLMQMAKVAGAILKLKTAGVPYITVLTDPTLGGVSASLAMLGDIIIAEPKATIGFAGLRVIEETTRKSLPEGFQTAEYLYGRGIIDMIVPAREMRHKLHDLCSLLPGNNENQ